MDVSPAGNESLLNAPFVGTWRLVSYVMIDSDGSSRPYWDDHPIGQLVYTANGQMCAQLYDGRRLPLNVDPESASAESVRPLYVGSAAYFGTYTVDTALSRVTHIVQGAWLPEWIGRRLTRSYRFISENQLELSVPGFKLHWQRVHE
ncbi:MAG TPA: lipocalin-like domain-containing protein [Candidatus Udaeobacter sp.]|nr:lipocalin-like domain-containing protein [Candidatus Udaeobacter sp.]